MISQIQNQFLPETHSKKTDEKDLSSLQKSHSKSIEEKIEEMAKSLSKVSTSPFKHIEIIKNLQANRIEHEKFMVSSQQEMLGSLNLLEKSLLSFDRERMMHQAGTKIQEEQITTRLDDFSYEFKKMDDNFHEKGLQHRQKIAKLKREMFELDNETKQKSQKVQRDSSNKLSLLESKCANNDTRIDSVRSEFKSRFKQLQYEIEKDSKQLYQQRRKSIQALTNLEQSFMKSVNEEQKKQKNCFSQNYTALEYIFKLLSEGISNQQ